MSELQTFALPSTVEGGDADKELGKELVAAWRKDGIFQIHATSEQQAATERALNASRDFFRRPLAEKARHVSDLTCSGYVASGEEETAGEKDGSEIFTVCPDIAADDARVAAMFVLVLSKIRVRGPVGRPRTRPDAVAGDKAYSSRSNRAHLRRRGIKAVIPEKKDQAANRKNKGSKGGRPVSHDTDLYKERNTVERLINKLKAWRGIATRYDKTPDSYLAGLHLRASMIWIKDLTRTTR